jgi:hypothetical protein
MLLLLLLPLLLLPLLLLLLLLLPAAAAATRTAAVVAGSSCLEVDGCDLGEDGAAARARHSGQRCSGCVGGDAPCARAQAQAHT